ncbi:hypothetical protein HGRIS_013010 [Hohenbuehelia grisea]|uniref:Uncharacterized protein n=1 Tax=Hohenbuehelia grisea TaxID=104357 RepID=A0ABR3IU43_9AGAR
MPKMSVLRPFVHRSLVVSKRSFHVSPPALDLVGPPDPISHLRPVIYDAITIPSGLNTNGRTNHPYSLTEFSSSAEPQQPLELQFRMQRQQLDAFHHAFWSDSNTRFEAGKAAVLASLPPNSSVHAKEDALSEFYRGWLSQEAPRTDAYTAEWRRRNTACIALAASVKWHRALARVGSWFGASTRSA